MNSLQEMLLYIKYTFITVFTPNLLKVLFAIIYLAFVFLFDVKQSDALSALFILILLDFLTGIGAAKINDEPIRSSKIRHSAVKIFAYYSCIAGAHLAEMGLVSYISFIDETVLAFFLLTELISLIENVGLMGYDTPKKLLNQLKKISENK